MKCEILLPLNLYENSPNPGSGPGVHVHNRWWQAVSESKFSGNELGSAEAEGPVFISILRN
jgi:hypothetical protein